MNKCFSYILVKDGKRGGAYYVYRYRHYPDHYSALYFSALRQTVAVESPMRLQEEPVGVAHRSGNQSGRRFKLLAIAANKFWLLTYGPAAYGWWRLEASFFNYRFKEFAHSGAKRSQL